MSNIDSQQELSQQAPAAAAAVKPRRLAKFLKYLEQCRDLPHAIILEILDFIEYNIELMKHFDLKCFAGRFRNAASERTFVLVRRSIGIRVLTLDQASTSSEYRSILRFLFRNVRHFSLHMFGFLALEQRLRTFFGTTCPRNGMFQHKLKSIECQLDCEIPLDDIFPSSMLDKICSVNLLVDDGDADFGNVTGVFSSLKSLKNLKTLVMDDQSFDQSNTTQLCEMDGVTMLFEQLRCYEHRTWPPYYEDPDLNNVSRILSSTTNLKSLYLIYSCFRDLESEQALRSLKKLDRFELVLQELADEQNMTNLASILAHVCTSLTIYNLKIGSLAGIEQFCRLQSLSIGNIEQIEDMSSFGLIARCSMLTCFSISVCDQNMFDAAARLINELLSKQQLKSLSFFNYVTAARLSLEDALPNLGFKEGVFTDSLEHIELVSFFIDSLDPITTTLLQCCTRLQTLSISSSNLEWGLFDRASLETQLVRDGVLLNASFEMTGPNA